MRDRLEKFIKMEGLTPSRFAEIMGVQPSSISHILGGRNKPSFDFLEKMLLRFPKINPDWLLLGKGSVYRSTDSYSETNHNLPRENAATEKQPSTPGTLPFEGITPQKAPYTDVEPLKRIQTPLTHTATSEATLDESSPISSPTPSDPTSMQPSGSKTTALSNVMAHLADDEIESIVIFLKDKTFLSYRPK